MQVSVENVSALERRMTVEVPEESVAEEIGNRLASLARTTRVDGFRPGKVPMKILKQRYGTQVRQEVISEVMRNSFYEAISTEEIHPAGQPTIEDVNDDPGNGFKFDASFEVYPEITLSDSTALEIECPVCEIADSDVDEMIETLRKQRVEWSVVERAAKSGDKVNIDFKGLLDGEAFDGGTSEGYDLELGSGSFVAGFEDGIVDKSASDEISLDLSFPDEYQNKELAGKAVVFEVKVNSVSESVLPEVNNEFIVEFGGSEEGGLEAFRNDIRENMGRERDQAVKNRTKQRVMDALLAANAFDVPKSLVTEEAGRLLEDMCNNLLGRGMPQEQTSSLQTAMFEDQASKRVSIGLIMAEVIKVNDIKVEPSRVRETIETMAASYDDPEQVLKWYYEDQSRLADVESSVLEDDVVEWVMGQAKTTEATVNFSDLVKPETASEEA